MNFRACHYQSSTATFILLASALTVLMTSTRTAAQQKPRENRAPYNSRRVTTLRRGNMIDVARSNLFTDFSDTINSSVSSGLIFNNSSTGSNGGYFHLGTSATDAYWGAANSTGGGTPFAATLANSAIFFGNRDNVPLQFLTSSAVRMTITGAGNVGIGTASPATTLHVNGAAQFGSGTWPSASFGGPADGRWAFVKASTPWLIVHNSAAVNAGNTAEIYLSARASTGAEDAAYVRMLGGKVNSTSGNYQSFFQIKTTGSGGNENTGLYMDGVGNVGIGTTSPTIYGGGLEVSRAGQAGVRVSDTAASGKAVEIGADTLGGFIQTVSPGADLRLFTGNAATQAMYLTSGGNVGIGTSTPGSKLDVNGSIYSAGQIRANSLSLIVWGTDASGTNRVLSGAPNIESQDAQGLELGTSADAPLVLYAAASERMRITSNGTTVTGNINATGSINARYQDVAEWVPASEQLSAGTVVVLDSTKSNQVTSSSVSYDTRVAGVISEQPGIALGEKSEGKVLVATTGRVRVKVDASKGPIHIGDLLVTSDVPGVAMKSEPVEFAGRKMHMPATLIGKALEPLDKGTGTILVLLSLQ